MNDHSLLGLLVGVLLTATVSVLPVVALLKALSRNVPAPCYQELSLKAAATWVGGFVGGSLVGVLFVFVINQLASKG